MSTPRWRLPTSAPVAERYIPNAQPILPDRWKDRTAALNKERFAALNDFVRARHGFLTSIPGRDEITMECLPDSTLPAELRALGYDVEATGGGERILPTGITEMVVTEGSTVARPVTHAGISRVERYSFPIDRQ